MTAVYGRVRGYFEDEGEDAGRVFYLTEPLEVPLPDGGSLTVPASESEPFRTDFASIPRVFWRIWPPIGRYTRAAIVHDYLCCTGTEDAASSDRVFLFLMEHDGVPSPSRHLIYLGLRLGSWLGMRTASGCAMPWSEIRRKSWAVKWARRWIIQYLRARRA